MRWPKRAGWKKPSGSYTYVLRDYRRPTSARRGFLLGLRIAVAVTLLIIALWHFGSAKTVVPRAVAASFVASAATGQSAQPPDLSPQLMKLFSDWAAQNNSANWGIAYQQLSGDSVSASYQPDQPFYPASIYKLLILEALFQKLPYDNWSKPLFKGVSYASCIDKMIRYSDNTCGIALGQRAGWNTVTKQLKSIGLTNTVLNTADSQLHTTAGDVARYLQSFYTSQTYAQPAQFALNVMGQQVFRAGIPAGSPGCITYDKIGDLYGYKHDAAVVVCPTISYILVVMSKGGSYGQIAKLANQVNQLLVHAKG